MCWVDKTEGWQGEAQLFVGLFAFAYAAFVVFWCLLIKEKWDYDPQKYHELKKKKKKI